MTPTANPRLQKPIANQPSPPAWPKITPSTDEPSPQLNPWFRFVYQMQIKIRQCSRDGVTLGNVSALVDFFISPYSRHKVRFTLHTSTSDRNFHGTKPHPPKSGHCSQTSASTDLLPSTTSPWLPIQPGITIVSPSPLPRNHAPPLTTANPTCRHRHNSRQTTAPMRPLTLNSFPVKSILCVS
jgi:hypothetical protein